MKKDRRTIVKALLLITQLGFNVLVTIFLCVWFGSFLDRKLGTGFLMIVFLVLGILAAYRNGYMMTKSFYTKNKSREELEQDYFDRLKKERESNDRQAKRR